MGFSKKGVKRVKAGSAGATRLIYIATVRIGGEQSVTKSNLLDFVEDEERLPTARDFIAEHLSYHNDVGKNDIIEITEASTLTTVACEVTDDGIPCGAVATHWMNGQRVCRDCMDVAMRDGEAISVRLLRREECNVSTAITDLDAPFPGTEKLNLPAKDAEG